MVSDHKAKLGKLLTRSQLAALPKPEPLIHEILGYRSAVLMVGDTGTNKTFAALGFAASVATGAAWLERGVARIGPVLYVVGEGAYGLDSRLTAWEKQHETVIPDDSFVVSVQPEPLPGVTKAIEAQAAEMGAVLVVLDTFSSLAPGEDETESAPLVTRWISDMSASLNCTVILVHHTGWGDKGRARGGSQLEANVDEVLLLEKVDAGNPDSQVKITRKKVKDGRAGGAIWVERVPVEESVVLVEVSAPEAPERARRLGHDDVQMITLQWITDHVPTTRKQVVAAVMAENGIGKPKADAAFDALEREKTVTSAPGKVIEGSREVTRQVWSAGPSSVRVRATG